MSFGESTSFIACVAGHQIIKSKMKNLIVMKSYKSANGVDEFVSQIVFGRMGFDPTEMENE